MHVGVFSLYIFISIYFYHAAAAPPISGSSLAANEGERTTVLGNCNYKIGTSIYLHFCIKELLIPVSSAFGQRTLVSIPGCVKHLALTCNFCVNSFDIHCASLLKVYV